MLKGNDNIIEECEIITNVADIANGDYYDAKPFVISPITVPQKYSVSISIYEAYAADASSKIVVYQRGPTVDEDTNRAEFMRTSYWFPKTASFHYGANVCTYNKDTGKFNVATASIATIKGAKSYGRESASKCLLVEQNAYAIRYLLIVNVE